MTRLVFAVRDGLAYAALDGTAGVTDLYADATTEPLLYGAVVTVRVQQLLPGQGAAIVSWENNGQGLEGYWHDVGKAAPASGATVRLQIKTAPRQGKLAQLSRDIALTGRFLVHLPGGQGVKASRRAGKAATVPDWLGQLPGGWVWRHTAASASAEQLQAEAAFLQHQAAQPNLPALSCWQRAVVDGAAGLQAMMFESAPALAAARAWLQVFAPDLLPLLRQDKDALDWDALLAEAMAETLALPDGGALTIEPTRAFVAVDVDAGAGQNHLQVNIHAAKALARQLRLRNIGGVVVADFITLRVAAEREKLLAALRRAVRDDPAGVEVFGLSRLGLVEMTRQRRAPSLAELCRD